MNYQELSFSQFDMWKLCEKLMISPGEIFLLYFWSLKKFSCLLQLSVIQHFSKSVWNYTDYFSLYPVCPDLFHSNLQFFSATWSTPGSLHIWGGMTAILLFLWILYVLYYVSILMYVNIYPHVTSSPILTQWSSLLLPQELRLHSTTFPHPRTLNSEE